MRLSLFFMDLNRIFTFKLGLLEEVPGQLTPSLAEVAFAQIKVWVLHKNDCRPPPTWNSMLAISHLLLARL